MTGAERTTAQGTFTILFTDLEGSTDLRVRVGDAAANEVINLHDDLVRSRLEIAGAVETKSLGDGFMALFTSANQAIQTAVTRVTRRGHKLGPDNLRVSAEAALRAHTYEGAVSLGREDDLGSLEAGKYADFAVLGADPLAVDAAEISQIPFLETWVGWVPVGTAARS